MKKFRIRKGENKMDLARYKILCPVIWMVALIILLQGMCLYSFAAFETTEVECSHSRCFIVSHPHIQSLLDLQQYVDMTRLRHTYMDTLLSYKAMITFKNPLSIEELSNLMPDGDGSLKFLTQSGSIIYYPHPLTFDENIGEIQRSNNLSQQNPPPPSLENDGIISAYVILPAEDLITLSNSGIVIAVDPGPIEVVHLYHNPEIVIANDIYHGSQFFGGLARQSNILEIPSGYFLGDNHPNPFNPITIFEYGLPEDSDVKLTVYNLMGQEVTILVDEHQEAGYKSVQWDASEYSSGIYFYKLQAGNNVFKKRMTLLK